jgi:hypothetical protein
LIDISIYNPCLLIIGIQTDNIIIFGDKYFSAREKHELTYANYITKPKEKLLVVTLLLFNSCIFSLDGTNINLRQKG